MDPVGGYWRVSSGGDLVDQLGQCDVDSDSVHGSYDHHDVIELLSFVRTGSGQELRRARQHHAAVRSRSSRTR